MNTIILFLCLCNMQDRGWCRDLSPAGTPAGDTHATSERKYRVTDIQGEVPSYLAFYHRAPSQKKSTPVLKRAGECKVDYDRKIEISVLTPIIYR